VLLSKLAEFGNGNGEAAAVVVQSVSVQRPPKDIPA
jgi:hypothetical protein